MIRAIFVGAGGDRLRSAEARTLAPKVISERGLAPIQRLGCQRSACAARLLAGPVFELITRPRRSLFCAQRFNHDAKCAASGKRDISAPISANKVSALPRAPYRYWTSGLLAPHPARLPHMQFSYRGRRHPPPAPQQDAPRSRRRTPHPQNRSGLTGRITAGGADGGCSRSRNWRTGTRKRARRPRGQPRACVRSNALRSCCKAEERQGNRWPT